MRTSHTQETDLSYCLTRASGESEYDNLQKLSEGTSIASASDCNIWANEDGNTVHLTGTTTVTDWGTAPNAGAYMWVICDAATPFTYNSTTNDMNTGGGNYTASAGDLLKVYARSTSSYKVTIFRQDGEPLVSPAIFTESFTSSEQTITSGSILNLAHSLSSTPYHVAVYLVCKTANQNWSVDDEVMMSEFHNESDAGIQVFVDSTNVNILIGNSGIRIYNKTTYTTATITNGSWKLIAKAWA